MCIGSYFILIPSPYVYLIYNIFVWTLAGFDLKYCLPVDGTPILYATIILALMTCFVRSSDNASIFYIVYAFHVGSILVILFENSWKRWIWGQITDILQKFSNALSRRVRFLYTDYAFSEGSNYHSVFIGSSIGFGEQAICFYLN